MKIKVLYWQNSVLGESFLTMDSWFDLNDKLEEANLINRSIDSIERVIEASDEDTIDLT